jgi:hypothetical protein
MLRCTNELDAAAPQRDMGLWVELLGTMLLLKVKS